MRIIDSKYLLLWYKSERHPLSIVDKNELLLYLPMHDLEENLLLWQGAQSLHCNSRPAQNHKLD